MKVVHLIARVNQGGTATWLKNLISGLRASGIDTYLLAGYCPENEIEDSSFKELKGIRIENLGRRISLIGDLKALFEIRKHLILIKPDVVNTHTAKAGTLGRIAVLTIFFNRPKMVHTYHGHVLDGYFNSITSWVFKIIERNLARITDAIFISSKKVKVQLLEKGIGKANKYRYVSPGISELKKISKNNACAQLGIENSGILIGWMGRLTMIKMPERFLDLAKNFPKYHFLMAGEGELRENLENLAPSNIDFVGWQNPEVFWSACDIAVLTSQNEGKPISLVEAAQIGIPVIAEDVGGVSEVVLDKITGILVSSDNQRSEALRKLIDNEEIRIQMGTSARNFALEEFGITKFVNRHIEIYRELVITA